jgi:DNA primase large subunit
MEVTASRVERVRGEAPTIPYDRLISLYETPPNEELSLDEFELFALDRLQLLRGIENLKTRGFEGQDYTNKLAEVYLILELFSLHSRSSDGK